METHSSKGNHLVNQLKSTCDIHTIDVQTLIPAGGGGKVMNSAKYHEKRKYFYSDVLNLGLETAFTQDAEIKSQDKLIEKLKVTLGRTDILKIISRSRRLRLRKKRG